MDPPHLVLPLTVEPTKSRLCHDERFLNLWINHCPFSLDTLRDVPRLINRDGFMTSIDEKSGYDHVLLSEGSRTYFGIQFGGYYMVYRTLPFGFKSCAFTYHSLGMVPTEYCRQLGVPILHIDDRLIGELEGKSVTNQVQGCKRAEMALFIVCQVFTRLGYTFGLKNCVLCPVQSLNHLGFLVDSNKQAFILPRSKIEKFTELRENLLSLSKLEVCRDMLGNAFHFH